MTHGVEGKVKCYEQERQILQLEDLTEDLRGVMPSERMSPSTLPKTMRRQRIASSTSEGEQVLSPWIEGRHIIGKLELLPRE